MSAVTDTKVIDVVPGVTNGTYSLGVVSLERLTAKITVVVDKSALEPSTLVTYRVYLGTDLNGNHWNNFDVRRNTWYQATLTLTGRGGADEVSWRIVTDLITHNGESYPWGKGGFAYTIDPSDSRFWSIESPYQNTLVTFAASNANLHPDSEYSEGRGVTYLNGTSQTQTAIRQCWRLNGENGITLSNVAKTVYYPLQAAPNIKTYPYLSAPERLMKA